MTGKQILRSLLGTSLLALGAVPAVAQDQTFLDLEAGLGYSSNPLLRIDDSEGSAYGRISAYGFTSWNSERSSTTLSAYAENTSYFQRFGNRQLFDLNATHSRQASETIRLFGQAGFSADFGAQLSSRFVGLPVDTPAQPLIPPSLVVVINPDLTAVNQRQYRINGQGGINISLSARDTFGATLGAQRFFYPGESALTDFNLYDATTSWRRQINERFSAGVRGIASYADYANGRSILSYGPQLTGDVQLAENLQLSAAVGFVRTERDLGANFGMDSSTDLALDGSLCRTVEVDRLCIQAARRNQSSVLGASPASTSVSGTFSRRLSARDNVQASVAYVRSGDAPEVGLGKQQFFTLAGAYDRRLSDRLSAGVSLAARKLSVTGPDPRSDIGGSIFIRNRFGSVR